MKELWFREMERLYNEALDDGVPDDEAYKQAGEKAHDALSERLADLADRERLRKKEGR